MPTEVLIPVHGGEDKRQASSPANRPDAVNISPPLRNHTYSVLLAHCAVMLCEFKVDLHALSGVVVRFIKEVVTCP